MVVAVNGSFKIPIAHFFTTGINAQGKKQLSTFWLADLRLVHWFQTVWRCACSWKASLLLMMWLQLCSCWGPYSYMHPGFCCWPCSCCWHPYCPCHFRWPCCSWHPRYCWSYCCFWRPSWCRLCTVTITVTAFFRWRSLLFTATFLLLFPDWDA